MPRTWEARKGKGFPTEFLKRNTRLNLCPLRSLFRFWSTQQYDSKWVCFKFTVLCHGNRMKTLGNRGGSKWFSLTRDEEDTNRSKSGVSKGWDRFVKAGVTWVTSRNWRQWAPTVMDSKAQRFQELLSRHFAYELTVTQQKLTKAKPQFIAKIGKFYMTVSQTTTVYSEELRQYF